ncbi:MAG: WbqC family protein, partial [Burkholderiales bacterium]|nr:WbqC family protein [Burkholderiales bacterium]
NPASGQDIFDLPEFARRGISLHFAQPREFIYGTAPYRYEPNLSILDVLMWNPPAVVAEALRNGLVIKDASTGSQG